MQEQIKYDVINILIPMVRDKIVRKEVQALFDTHITYHVNPTGRFVIGGPAGDSGLTGRKIIVDTYGGRAAHGGGAFSGKDPSKVDRSAAYVARYIAKNLVASDFSEKMQIQLAYAIGVSKPVSVSVETFGTANIDVLSKYGLRSDDDIAQFITENFDLSPWGIEKMLGLKQTLFFPTASYGHFGREPYEVMGTIVFPWEVVSPLSVLVNESKNL